MSLDIRNLPAGVYLIRLHSDWFTAVRKLVVER
jgi:hypothetical protein